MQYKEAEIAETVYFWFAANGTDGAAGDGASPLFYVRLAGAAAGAAPTASGTPTLLTHANYSDGLYEIAIDTTGYTAGEYAVFCTLTISTVNPAGFCGSFRLKAAGASIHSATAAIVGDHGVVSIQDDVDEILTRLPDATAGAAGGLMIAGSNAATTLASLTVTGLVDINNGVDVSCTTADRAAVVLTGNGIGPGLYVEGGNTASGIKCSSGIGSTDKAGLEAIGVGTAARGIQASGVLAGLNATASAGNGISATGTAGDIDADEIDAIPVACRDVTITGAAAGSVGETIATIGSGVSAIQAETDPFCTGAIVEDVGNSATVFMTNLAATTDDKFNRCLIRITSGDLTGEVDKIIDYDGTNKIITIQTGFTAEPAAGVTFAIENQ